MSFTSFQECFPVYPMLMLDPTAITGTFTFCSSVLLLKMAHHQITGNSPALLMYSRECNTPLDLWMQPELELAPQTVNV